MKYTRKTTMRSLTIVLLTLVVFGTAIPRQAHAQWATFDVVTEVQSTLSAISDTYSEISQYYLELKESTLDPLAWALAKILLQQMAADTVNWINSGFQGNPAFLNNPGGFLLNSADQLTSGFISQNGPLSSLCSPFSADIRITLALQQAGRSRNSGGSGNGQYACTLGTVIQNVQNASGNVSVNGTSVAGFMGGDFMQGGWPAFMAMTTEPQNNYIGSYLQADSDLQERIADKQASINLDLNRGNGFMSWQSCTDVTGNIDGGTLSMDDTSGGTIEAVQNPKTGETTYKQCQTQTPGSVISSSLNKELGAGTDSLVAADEIDEVVGALAGQLLKQVLTGGLASASKPQPGSSQSYIDQMANENNPSLATMTKNISQSAAKNMKFTVSYKATRDQTLAAIQNVQTSYLTLMQKCQSIASQTSVDALQAILVNQINPLLVQYQTKDIQAAAALATLTNIQTEAANATTTAEASAVAQELSNLYSSGSILTQLDVTNATNDLKAVQKSLKQIRQAASKYQLACNAGIVPGAATTTLAAPTVTFVDLANGIITGTGFTDAVDVSLVSTVSTVTTEPIFNVLNDSTIMLDFSAANVPPGENKLFVENAVGTSQAYKIDITQ